MPDDAVQHGPRPRLAEDAQPSGEVQPYDRMQAFDVVQVEMAEKEVGRLRVCQHRIHLVDAVARVEDDVAVLALEQRTDRVAPSRCRTSRWCRET
jgi:hypothetical protein